jgi:hypothetical protein
VIFSGLVSSANSYGLLSNTGTKLNVLGSSYFNGFSFEILIFSSNISFPSGFHGPAFASRRHYFPPHVHLPPSRKAGKFSASINSKSSFL